MTRSKSSDRQLSRPSQHLHLQRRARPHLQARRFLHLRHHRFALCQLNACRFSKQQLQKSTNHQSLIPWLLSSRQQSSRSARLLQSKAATVLQYVVMVSRRSHRLRQRNRAKQSRRKSRRSWHVLRQRTLASQSRATSTQRILSQRLTTSHQSATPTQRPHHFDLMWNFLRKARTLLHLPALENLLQVKLLLLLLLNLRLTQRTWKSRA